MPAFTIVVLQKVNIDTDDNQDGIAYFPLADFDQWAKGGAKGWSYADLEPYVPTRSSQMMLLTLAQIFQESRALPPKS